MKILVLNGPNLNMLGIRKPEIYGIDTLDAINTYLKKKFPDLDLEFYQSNIEGEIINRLHFALRLRSLDLSVDAIKAIRTPVIEVHLSNIAAREDFRHISVISPVAEGTISGFGRYSYVLALQAMAYRLSKKEK